MSELKQKFIDILFEKDAPDAEDDFVESTDKENKKEHSTIKAADILYRKGSNNSPFINLNEGKKVSAKELLINEKEEYRATPKLSPIFGLINDSKTNENKMPTEVEPIKTSGKISHLDIVPSPIYGYGTKEDYFKSSYMSTGTSFAEEEHDEHENIPQEEDPFLNNDNNIEEDNITLFDEFGDLL